MLSHDRAETLLKAATFRLHLGTHRDRGELTEFFGTGFFVASDGVALTAFHNFEGCAPGQIFKADYKGTRIGLQWIPEQSSERADIAVMRLVDRPHELVIEGLRVGYLDPEATLATRKEYFKDRVRVSIFGYPQRDRGGEGWRIDGAVDASQPIIDSHEVSPPIERLCIQGSRIADLEGISGAGIFASELELVSCVEWSNHVRGVEI
jgi:hypothetical protein